MSILSVFFMRGILACVRVRRAFRSCLRTPTQKNKTMGNQQASADEFCRNALVSALERHA